MRLPLLFVTLGAPLTLLSCTPSVSVGVSTGNYAQDKTVATAVERFHAQYNDDEFVAIYNESTLSFQSTTTKSKLVALMNQTKERYGEVVNTVLIGEKAFPDGQIRSAYNTKFQKGEATELFIWQLEGKKARLQMVKTT